MFCYFPLSIFSQQPNVGKATSDCSNRNASNSVLGYTCNGVKTSCQAYLTFRSKPPHNTVSTISSLLASDPSQLAKINSVSETYTFETNQLVIVPVNCSCSGQYYQANASYNVVASDTHFILASRTFQGLSTSTAVLKQNSNITTKYLYPKQRLVIPLRCACPTKNQIDLSVNYLMSYLVAEGNCISRIAVRFGTDIGWTLEANGLSEENSVIQPSTTLLVPLKNPPSSSQTVEPPPSSSHSPSVSSPLTSSSYGSSVQLQTYWLYSLVGFIGGSAFVMVFCTIIFFRLFRRIEKKIDSIVAKASEKPVEKRMEKKEFQDYMKSLSKAARQPFKNYTFEELQLATNNFSPSCLIKGSVYRGIFIGDFAAIKKMDRDISKDINVVNKINHSNLTRLLGVCFNTGCWYLVYEYASNGPFSDWIFKSEKSLTWMQRIQIASDVATGLNYLRSFANPSHVHKDIKSNNILLEGDFRAKIANFGLARSTQGQLEGQFSMTKHIVGNFGYMAPDSLEIGLVSKKLDVYTFGVLLLEMFAGKQVSVLSAGTSDEGQDQSLRHLIDHTMLKKYPSELVDSVDRLLVLA
ncbi:hypothetical protein TIFTF001_002534 [Ficus carica]|uniref:Uncharacterized protein n=1 Tax=Ficus carica TaxID=3494 RepID=A0AA87Z483_FICCA|nr:hypothetical protein TIFTF001_002534 [Ficus carica]